MKSDVKYKLSTSKCHMSNGKHIGQQAGQQKTSAVKSELLDMLGKVSQLPQSPASCCMVLVEANLFTSPFSTHPGNGECAEYT